MKFFYEKSKNNTNVLKKKNNDCKMPKKLRDLMFNENKNRENNIESGHGKINENFRIGPNIIYKTSSERL